jgi:ParB family chromosome partitioning protein
MTQSTLGRGLGSLIPSRSAEAGLVQQNVSAGERIQQLETGKIQPNSHQPRRHFDNEAQDDLIKSIKIHGIIQPLIVVEARGQYQLVAGERRLRAAKALGLKTVPAVVRSVTNQQKLELAVVENVQRQNLNPLEKAHAYKQLIEEFSLTQEEVSKKVGQSRASVTNILRLLQLPDEIQKALGEGKISEGHAKVLLGISSEEERLRIFKEILKNNLSVRSTEGQAQRVTVKKHSRVLRKDANLRDQEEKLQDALGTKVEIKKSGQQGTVLVHFYSGEELQEIIRKIIK